MTTPQPLLFTPILKSKVWGGRRLSSLGKALPPEVKIGESWELADLDSTSPSGGGGDAAHSVIRQGALAGKTIRDAMELWGADLLGELDGRGGFPLLVKFLDASENLSVQVHPSPEYAHREPESQLKTEAWYIVDVEPGSVIYAGLRPGVGPEAFAEMARQGTVEAAMEAIPAHEGDCYNLPSGTVHALGAGVLVAEVQTPSDTTFRLFDWGREGRELHVERAIECAQVGPLPAAQREPAPETDAERLVVTEYFTIDRWRGPADRADMAMPNGRPRVVMCLRGEGRIGSERGAFDATDLRAGDTALLPAALDGPTLSLGDGATALDVTVGPLPV